MITSQTEWKFWLVLDIKSADTYRHLPHNHTVSSFGHVITGLWGELLRRPKKWCNSCNKIGNSMSWIITSPGEVKLSELHHFFAHLRLRLMTRNAVVGVLLEKVEFYKYRDRYYYILVHIQSKCLQIHFWRLTFLNVDHDDASMILVLNTISNSFLTVFPESFVPAYKLSALFHFN